MTKDVIKRQTEIYAGVIRSSLIHSFVNCLKVSGASHKQAVSTASKAFYMSERNIDRHMAKAESTIEYIARHSPAEACAIVTGSNRSEMERLLRQVIIHHEDQSENP